jgi:hypothetical protein
VQISVHLNHNCDQMSYSQISVLLDHNVCRCSIHKFQSSLIMSAAFSPEIYNIEYTNFSRLNEKGYPDYESLNDVSL